MRFFPFIAFLLYTSGLSAQLDGICKGHLAPIIELEQHSAELVMNFTANVLTQDYDLKYHRLEWEVDPANYYIKGRITSYFVPTAANFQRLHFDFSDPMTINSITYHGNMLSTYAQPGEDVLQIDLPAMVPMNQLDSITVAYEGAPPSDGFGSFVQSTHNQTPLLWTLSEPYGAKTWWPCKQDLSDKIDSIDVIVRTPNAYRVATNGVLQSETPMGNDMEYHWSHRYPIPAYLIAIAVTDYATYSDYLYLDNGDSIEILNYVFPENLSDAQDKLGSTLDVMELFNELFGVYPFASEKYGHAEFGWGGGMEHQTMSFMGSFAYGLQAHELAHQWFGNKVTCSSWEDIWLNEGFASYLTALTYDFFGSVNTWKGWKTGNIENITAQPGGSVWVNDTTSVNRIFSSRLSYRKGSYLLHMLRWYLGDDDFFEALRNYLNDPALAYGYATTADLKAHLESQSGFDLTEFFNDWYYKEGFPSYQVTWSKTATGISLKLGQTTSHPSVDFFEMPVPIFVAGGGQDSLLRLDHSFSGQEFIIDLPFEVKSVSFDPDYWLLSTNNVLTDTKEVEQLAQSIQLSPNPMGNRLNLQLPTEEYQIDKIEIRDIQGHLIQTLENRPENSHLDTSKWPAGTYVLTFYSADLQVSKKAIKR